MSGNLSQLILRRITSLAGRELRSGERLIRSGCSDVAACGCEHHMVQGHPCTVIGRDEAARVDRCLVCGATWRSRDYRWQRLEVISAGPESALHEGPAEKTNRSVPV